MHHLTAVELYMTGSSPTKVDQNYFHASVSIFLFLNSMQLPQCPSLAALALLTSAAEGPDLELHLASVTC